MLEIMSARKNFDYLRMWCNRRILTQDAQTGQIFHPPNPGAPRRAVPRARPQPMKAPEA